MKLHLRLHLDKRSKYNIQCYSTIQSHYHSQHGTHVGKNLGKVPQHLRNILNKFLNDKYTRHWNWKLVWNITSKVTYQTLDTEEVTAGTCAHKTAPKHADIILLQVQFAMKTLSIINRNLISVLTVFVVLSLNMEIRPNWNGTGVR